MLMVQDGARLHYAVPVALKRAGILARMVTDWYTKPGSLNEWIGRAIGLISAAQGRRLRERHCAELDDVSIDTSIRQTFSHQRRHRYADRMAFYQHESRQAARRLLRRGFGEANAVMGFIRNAHPDIFEQARRRGMVTVGDQMIAPAVEELRQFKRQQERFGDWQPNVSSGGLERLIDVERRIWSLLDHVTCASPYVRDGLLEEGVEAERVSVLPYPIDTGAFEPVDRTGRKGPMTVGFVGTVNLRKGVPYFLEVARRCAGEAMRFVMVGPVQIERDVLDRHRGPVEVVGAVPRSKVRDYLRQFDVILFPSTCEGSAGALTEAMSMSLPIVTSPNSGTIIRDGVEGYIASYDDVESYAARLAELAGDAERRWAMGRAARLRAEQFNLDWYSGQLGDLFDRLFVEAKTGGG